MSIDRDLLKTLVDLYEDEIDEKDIEDRLKKMSASAIIDLKNALDNDNYSQVDSFMGIKLDESFDGELSTIMILSGLSDTLTETASAGGTSAGSIASSPTSNARPKKKKVVKKPPSANDWIKPWKR